VTHVYHPPVPIFSHKRDVDESIGLLLLSRKREICGCFMFYCPCISICVCNDTNLMHYLSSVYWVTIPLHVSGLLVAHHQEVTMYIRNSWYVLYVSVDCQLAWLEWNSTSPADSQVVWTIFSVVYSAFFIVLWHCTALCYCFSSVYCTVHCSGIVLSACDVPAATLTEVSPWFFLTCKANARV
jgi:hypothetical protein